MRLEDELKAIDCTLCPDEFRERIVDIYAETNRDRTLDLFRCRWMDLKDFCMAVRSHLDLPVTSDSLIVRTLDNIRRKGKLNVADRRPPQRFLKDELKEVAGAIGIEEFREVIVSTFKGHHAGWTVDQLLNRWPDSGHFCAVVRGHFSLPRSPRADALILHTLINLRKVAEGGLSLRDRRSAAGTK